MFHDVKLAFRSCNGRCKNEIILENITVIQIIYFFFNIIINLMTNEKVQKNAYSSFPTEIMNRLYCDRHGILNLNF
jgi:hypothetical protein